MTTLPAPEPLFLSGLLVPSFATLHRPAPDSVGRGPVLLCPPFGWEEVSAYRPLREWAIRLAAVGHPTLRLSLPGTGDSAGGPDMPDLVSAWTTAVGSAAGWLREAFPGGRLASVGIGLGGLLSCLAAAQDAPVDDLVLWAVPSTGAAVVRQQRAFGRMERSLYGAGRPRSAPAEEDGIVAGGFRLSRQTADALQHVELSTLTLPPGRARRALLLEVAGRPEGGGLDRRLAEIGVSVSRAPGDGLSDVTAHPQGAQVPVPVLEAVSRWLDGGEAAAPGTGAGPAVTGPSAAAPPAAPDSPVAATSSITLPGPAGGREVRESPVSIPTAMGQLAGILAEPAAGPAADVCVVLLNAGAVRRIGPNRMWVEAARRWAAWGVPVLRLDLFGIGDSEGAAGAYADDSELYAPAFVPQVLDALDELERRGVAGRFAVGGLCSGAYWAFHAALRDARISDLLLVNPRALIWTPALGPRRDVRALFSELPTIGRLRRNLTGPRIRAVLHWLAGTPRELIRRVRERDTSAVQVPRRLDAGIDSLVSAGTRVLLLFSDREPLRAELARTGTLRRMLEARSVRLAEVGIADHSLRPRWAQREAHAELDAAVRAAAGITGPAPAPPAVPGAARAPGR